jgi:DNA-binding transcriptional regulator LsrR (DeoR family)
MSTAANTDRILAWLTHHQGSTVKQIAAGTGLGSQYISARLKGAVMAGRARQDREHGAAPWQWSALKVKR